MALVNNDKSEDWTSVICEKITSGFEIENVLKAVTINLKILLKDFPCIQRHKMTSTFAGTTRSFPIFEVITEIFSKFKLNERTASIWWPNIGSFSSIE